MKKMIWGVALLLATACTNGQKEPAQEEWKPAVCFDNWDQLGDKLAYFKELIDLQDSAIAGNEISIQHLQSLMPQNEEDYHVFIATQPFAILKEGDDDVESPRALYVVAGEMAAADTLDMMEKYLMWFDWCDGWVAETVWDKAFEIEKRHPERFQQLIKKTRWYWDWQEYRDEMNKYYEENK